MRNTIIILIIVTISYSCDYIKSIDKEGVIVSKEMELLPFKSIVVDAPYHITLIQSDENHMHLEGLDYLMDEVLIEQADETLYLKHESAHSIQKSKMINLFIYTSNIQSLTANEPGQLFTSDTLRIPQLSLIVNGGGTYFETDIKIDVQQFSLSVYGTINTGTHRIAGKAVNASFWMEGCTYAYADELICQQVTFTHRSAANCYVSAEATLNATLFSGGNLYYAGNPDIVYETGYSPMLKATGQLLPVGN